MYMQTILFIAVHGWSGVEAPRLAISQGTTPYIAVAAKLYRFIYGYIKQDYLTWFRRLGEPKVRTDDYEQVAFNNFIGTYLLGFI